MGHSYCSGPIVLSQDRKNNCSAASAKKKLQLRSPGCPYPAHQVDLRDSFGNGLGKEIRDFLQREQPPLEPTPAPSRTNSKRKKQILNMLLRSRHRSSRPLICHPSVLPSVAKDQMTVDGRKYSQIGFDDKQMFEVGNSSTYRINYCKQPGSSAITDTSSCITTAAPIVLLEKPDDPAPQLDIVNDYDVDISKEWPLELLGSGETKLPQEAETEMRNGLPSVPSPRSRPGIGPRVRDFASSSLRASPGIQESDVARQPSPILRVSDDTLPWMHPQGSPVHASHRLSVNGTQVPVFPNLDPVPIRNQVRRLQASPPKTPRRSRQKSSLEMAVSPMFVGRSKTPSILSTNESVVDDVQSDAESAIVMEARSAEFVRAQGAAGYYNGPLKPPKPGPAPTRALPSLPKGHDGSALPPRGSVDNAGGRTSLGSGPGCSPKKIPPKSPARRYGYLPSNAITSRDPSMSPSKSVDLETEPEPSKTPSIEEAQSSSPLLPPNDLPLSRPSPMALEQRQNQRTRSIKALKMRDLERMKARRSATSPAVLPTAKPPNRPEDPAQIVFLPNTRYSAKPSSPNHLPQSHNVNNLSSKTCLQPKHTNSLSSIMLIAEQAPNSPSPVPIDTCPATCGRSAPPNSPTLPLPLHFPSPPPPGNPTAPPRPMSVPTDPTLGSPFTPFDPLTHRISMSHADLEARLESRIAALEKKNLLLERAFLSVLNTSAGLGVGMGLQTPVGIGGGDRTSGGNGWEGVVRGVVGGSGERVSGGVVGGGVL